MSGFGIKDCLTEASLGWKCFGTYNKDENFTLLTINMLEISYVNRSKVVEWLLISDILNQTSVKKY